MDREKMLENEISELREILRQKECFLSVLRKEKQIMQPYGLNNEEILRYSRQIILPEIGIKGQKALKDASVLIVGAGGLGCPSSLYLSGAGVGSIGIVDYDEVELNNLHRQLLFSRQDLNTPKVEAAKNSLTRLNDNIKVTPYKLQLDSSNALEIVKKYDVVVDATDNVATRYLLNDACVIAQKPLVSGSALRFEGQLTVYNYDHGPCYRCIFPTPPPPETVTNCGDGGVLGAVVGTIGVLQALEVVKVILNLPGTFSGKLLMFDTLGGSLRTIQLRPKNPNCSVCGENPKISKLIDYEQFCGTKANDKNPDLKILEKGARINVEDFASLMKNESNHNFCVDVRSREEFEICSIHGFMNFPFDEIEKAENLEKIKKEMEKTEGQNVYVLCRRGNDSQKAVRILQKVFADKNLKIQDIVGGIHAWAKRIDNNIPVY